MDVKPIKIGRATKLLLNAVDRFLERSGLKESTLGQYALREPKVIPRLRAGGNISVERAGKLRSYMDGWKPPQRRRGPRVEGQVKKRSA